MFELYKNFLNKTFRDAQRHHLIAALAPFFPEEKAEVLDIGAGNGEFAALLQKAMPSLSIQGCEVTDRGKSFIPMTYYDGKRVPFADKSFDYAMVINMLHHTADPRIVLKEAARVSRKGIIIKDHYANNRFDYYNLLAMEYMNPGFRQIMQLPLHFYSEKEWSLIFAECSLVPQYSTCRFPSYGCFWDIFFGRKMHFIGKYSCTA